VGYAAGNVYTAKCRPADIDSLVGANGMMCASALLLLIATLVSGQWFVLWGEFSLINSLITIHGVISAVAFTLFFVLVRIAGPVYFSQVAYLVTFFGIAIAMVVFGERYSLWHWAALVVTVCGVWLVNSAQKQITTAQPK
jgi:drug/metabolite transporter (DMT)-like permease